MRVALALPPKPGLAQDHFHRTPQCGIGYLAGALRKDGVDQVVYNSKFEGIREADLTRTLIHERYDIVGFSAMTFEIKSVGRIAKQLKAADKNCLVAVGGAHANAIPLETMQEFPEFDLICIGEHEDHVSQIFQALYSRDYDTLSRFDNIIYRAGGELHHKTLTRRFIKDINTLPWPAYDLFGSKNVNPAYFTARGCPFGCSFCQQNSGRVIRKRSPNDVCDEIEHYSGYFGQTEFTFRDESFTVNKEHAAAVCHEMIRRGLHKRLRWSCETHSRSADYDLFCLMKEAGCYYVDIGIESGADEVLKSTGKSTTVDIILKSTEMVKRAKLKLGGLFILGHPNETKRTLLKTILLGARINPDSITFSMMTPFPGTKVYEFASKHEAGLRLLTKDWEKYDNIAGYAMAWDSFSVRFLKMMQPVGIVLYHVYNLRLRQLARYVWVHRKGIVAYFLSYFAKKRITNGIDSAGVPGAALP